MTRRLWKVGCLVLITMAVYWPVRHYEFISYDDNTYLFSNPFIRYGLTRSSFHDAFTHARLDNYAPLVSLSYCLDQNLFDLQPGPMHVENVILHLFAGLLLWLLLYECTGRSGRAFVVSALFLCHPMHVESVAWISERKDVLSTGLLFIAIIAYVRFAKSKSAAAKIYSYLLLLAFYTASLLTKSMGVTLPGALLLLDYWPLCRVPLRSWKQLVVEKIPILLLAIIFAVVTRMTQSPAVGSLESVSVSARIGNAAICYLIYVAKLALPTNLAVFYPHPMTRPVGAGIAAIGILLVITRICYKFRKREPYLIVGWLWFLGTLLPVIGFIQVGSQSMADRYSYLPSIGLFIAAIWGASDLFNKVAAKSSVHLYLTTSVSTIVIVSFSVAARIQVSYWRDTKTLFTHANDVTEGNYVAHCELGECAFTEHDIKRAAEEFEMALAFAPDAASYDGLGRCWLSADRAKAIKYFRLAINLRPSVIEYHLDLAVASRLNSDFSQAREQVNAALEIDPVSANAHNELLKLERLGNVPASNH